MTERKVGTPMKDANSVETRISTAEQALGLTTRAKILLEARLLIDRPFFDWAVVSGFPEKPERLFGDEEWYGHLNARLFARQYGKKPLTLEFIEGLHNCHLEYTHPGVTDHFGQRKDPQGGPAILSSEQARNVGLNPLISWKSDDPTWRSPIDSNGNLVFPSDTGTFFYIPRGYTSSTPELKIGILQRLCDWYNGERDGFYTVSEGRSSNLTPYERAGSIQHRFCAHRWETPYTKDKDIKEHYKGSISQNTQFGNSH